MRRVIDFSQLSWSEKTLGKIQEAQLEELESHLDELPMLALFDEDFTDVEAEELWDISYDAEEHPGDDTLHSVESLRSMVSELLVRECMLLGMEEEKLLERALTGGGETRLEHPGELPAAVSLVRRMWCSLDWQEGGAYVLMLPEALRAPLGLLMNTNTYHGFRMQLFNDSMEILLAMNENGLVRYQDAADFLAGTCAGTVVEGEGLLRRRLILSFADYIILPGGETVLVHPALADPQRMLPQLRPVKLKHRRFKDVMEFRQKSQPPQATIAAMNRLEYLIAGAVRPEISAEQCVNELHLLAMQDVSLPDLREVLASQLMQRPTSDMEQSLRQLKMCTVTWLCCPARTVQ